MSDPPKRSGFAFVSLHAVEALRDLGVNLPYDDMVRLMLSKLRDNFNIALTVQQDRKKWIVPCVIPSITQTPRNPMARINQPVSFWGVLAAPTDEMTIGKFRYVVLTSLHPNSPIVRRLWDDGEPGDMVENYIRFKAT